MRSRALLVTVVAAAALLVVGFAVLSVGAAPAARDIDSFRAAQDLAPRTPPDRWTLLLLGYAGGIVLSLLVAVLMGRWWGTGRWRGGLVLALWGEMALGLFLAVDGLLSLTPSDDLADLIPTWFAPLNVAQGLATVVVFGLAVMALPQPASREASWS